MSAPRCSSKLCAAAKKAARNAARAHSSLRVFSELFEREYGHSDISDALVEIIDYSIGSTEFITREFIAEHSGKDRS